jgi:hypothetical protein
MPFESFAHVPVTEELLRHAWEGESNSKTGGHRCGLGRDKKTEFPEMWSLEHVRKAIEAVLTRPQAVHHFGTSVNCLAQVGGVVIIVKLIRVRGRTSIQTAFPLCGEGVFQNRDGVPVHIPLDLSVLEA